MLILTRKPGEEIIIGDAVVVTVVDIDGRQARIGINAPKEMEVHRREVYDRKRKEDQSGNS